MARVVAVLLGLDHLPGATDHPLLLVVAADHPDGDARHQGRRGRRVHLRRRRDRVPVRQGQQRHPARTRRTRSSPTRRPAPRPRPAGGGAVWHDPREDGALPDVYIAMGQTAENVAGSRASPARSMDEFGVRVAEPGREGHRGRLLGPGDHPGHAARRHRGRPPTTARGPASPWRASPASSRCSGRTARSPPATAARSTTAPPRW